MGRPERPIDPDAGPLERFAYDLRVLRRRAGQLSYRELAKRAHYSDTTLSVAASGATLPSLEVTLAFVAACGGDVKAWEQRWHATAGELRAMPAKAGVPVASPGGEPGSPRGGPGNRRWGERLGSPRAWVSGRWRSRRGRLAATALGVAVVAGATAGVMAFTGHVGGITHAKSFAATVGPGCAEQAGASFTALGAWQRHRQSRDPGSGEFSCGSVYLTTMLRDNPGRSLSTAEWSFRTGAADHCTVWIYLPNVATVSQDAGFPTYSVLTSGKSLSVGQFEVAQEADAGLAFPKGPFPVVGGQLRVRLTNNANGGLLRPIAAAAVHVDCS